MADADRTPVWIWLPGQTEPVLAAEIQPDGRQYRLTYDADYRQRDNAVALDPVHLRLGTARAAVSDELPGVIQDAKPSGYAADRLNAQWPQQYARDLTEMELLEVGPGDTIGAIEVCRDIERKRRWRAKPMDDLMREIEILEEDAPASRAIRRINGDQATSAGGERPKATFAHDGSLWLVKMQDRGDRAGMPALEFTAMSLAGQAGIRVPRIALQTAGRHQAFMIERFDRHGDVDHPARLLYASAHTLLKLRRDSVRGDARRSYLLLAEALRRWNPPAAGEALERQLHELWCRMAFNALVGNVDDHARNHGVLHNGEAWELSPAFDITPIWRPTEAQAGQPVEAMTLALATGVDGGCHANIERLLAAAEYFALSPEAAATYLVETATMVADQWEQTLARALAPVDGAWRTGDAAAVIASVRPAFGMSQFIADDPDLVLQRLATLMAQRPARRRKARWV